MMFGLQGSEPLLSIVYICKQARAAKEASEKAASGAKAKTEEKTGG